ncbi:MAG: peptidase C11, partial [Clostridia bacterium]|nr:peptidase C11 [Clostridia bacterium]
MDRKTSGGRKKRVTSGGGNAKRRGSGTGSGPVGRKDKYSGRRKSGSSYSSGAQGSSGSSGSSGGGNRSILSGLFGGGGGKKKSSMLKTIIIIIIIVVVGYFVIKSCSGNDAPTEDLSAGNNAADDNSISSTVDENDLSSSSDDENSLSSTVSNNARAKRTKILGNGQDVHTIMIYMCGSDLESKYGMATADLKEMIAADVGANVNVIIETGGAKKWDNSTVSSDTNQRFLLEDSGLKLLQDNLGRKAMTDPNTLTDFIRFSKENFPANRYSLIFWDHGAGSLSGFGYDEFAPGTTMTLDEINSALKNADTVFDFIGFDACLMATFETAVMLNNYADYMIASEEIEPGRGWYYTDWISAISADTSMSTVQIGKNIIDSFIEVSYQNSSKDKTTLSIVDLAELSGNVPEAFRDFAVSTGALIDSDQYQVVSNARSDARGFGVPTVDNQVDLIHLAQGIGTPEARAFIAALEGCIKYNRTSNNISNANGLSIYFPYGKLSTLQPMLNTYDEIGMDAQYSDTLKSFANLEVGGQAVSSGTGNPLESLLGQFTGGQTGSTGADLISGLLGSFLGEGDFSSILGDVAGGASDWINPDKIRASTEYYENNYLDSADLVFTKKGNDRVLSLTDEQWDIVQNISLNVFLDDGEGFIDLGMDNTYTFDEDFDLVADYDGTWLALNGQVVSYYFMSEDGDTITGRVPAMLNGQ